MMHFPVNQLETFIIIIIKYCANLNKWQEPIVVRTPALALCGGFSSPGSQPVRRLWRGVQPVDLSDNLIVQVGTITEDLNRRWYERNTGQSVEHVQKRIQHPVIQMDGGDPQRF